MAARRTKGIPMNLADLNYVAVAAAAALSFAVGALWYSPILFARAWTRESGVDEARLRQASMAKVFGLSFLCSLVMALNLAAFLGDQATVGFGLFAGAATGIGWVAMALGVTYLFERRSFKLWLINSGYQVLTLTLMGGLLGAWR
jgi:hypothetical protein